MLNFDQTYVDEDFIALQPYSSISELQSQLLSHRFAVIIGEDSYVMTAEEASLLSVQNPSVEILSWLKAVKWIPSALVKLEDLSSEKIDWRRPAVVMSEGKLIGVITASEWIYHLQKELERTAAYFYTLAETANDAVSAVDGEGNVICWNEVAEATYSIKKEQIVGRKIGEYFQAEDIVLHRVLQEGLPVRRAYHRPDSDTHVLINAAPIVLHNQIIGGVATEHDITRIVRLNEELYGSAPQLMQEEQPFSSIIGVSAEIQHILQVAQKTTYADIPVLLTGEAGSGKEMLAQAIHYSGPRQKEPFLSIHCLAVPAGLLEAELFGYQRKAFTGEEQEGQAGKLEKASKGTLFIADIDKMPFDLQVKLAYYLEHQSFQRIGSEEAVTAEARIIASSSPEIEEMIQRGEFHQDLYYHLNIIKIDIPPLRERMEDVVEFIQKFMRDFTLKYKKPMPVISPEVMTMLMNYDWPGNVRELRNAVERFILLSDGESITVEQLPKSITAAAQQTDFTISPPNEPPQAPEMDEAETVEEALRKTYGNKSAAAKLLGISRATLYNKIKEYGIEL